MQTLTLCQLLVCFLLIFHIVESQYTGEQCSHKKKNVSGICKLLEKCPNAIKDLQSGVFPQNCGFEGSAVVVCCVGDSAPTTTTTTTTTARTTTTTTTATTTTPRPPTTKVGDRSRQACQSYEKLGYKREVPPILVPGVDFINVDICPWEVQALSVIIEGEKCKEGEFPHMALIGYGTPDSYAWKCGGSLISDRFVLTAAHCLFARGFGEPKFVRLGDLNYTDPTDDRYKQQINVKKLHKHPDYISSQQYNDLALLELETPANVNLYVKPACLYLKDPTNEAAGMITGWGITENGTESDFLLKATVEVFPHQLCNKTYRNERRTLPRGIDPRIQICYGSHSNRKDSCQGDSGGPLQIYARNTHCSYYVFGITSFGKGCGNKDIAAVYVNVYAYIDWIENIVWP